MALDTNAIDTAISTFEQMCSSDRPLANVVGHCFMADGSPMLVAIRLAFGNECMIITASEDDSLIVSAGHSFSTIEKHEEMPMSEMLPWKTAINRPLLWAWTMVNQQGYFDGIQLEFGESSESAVSRIQLLAIASEIKHQPTGK